jgi:hypothetical protein
MMKSAHADMLCREGIIGLGPLNYYTTVENKRIADGSEGLFITHAEGEKKSVWSVTSIGNHVLVYCTTTNTDAQFEGYDACVEIADPARFAEIISATITKKFAGKNRLSLIESSRCVYQHSRIISGPLHGFTEALIELGEMSRDTIDVLSNKKYLIKESSFSRDCEFRFAFVMETDVTDYVLLSCPDVTSMCRRLR